MLPQLLAVFFAFLSPLAWPASGPSLSKDAVIAPLFSTSEDTLLGEFPKPLEGIVDGKTKSSVKDFLERQAPRSDAVGIPLAPNWVKALEEMLVVGQYKEIEKLSREQFRDSASFTEWITQKAQSVDVRLMWTLAERHALARRYEPAAQWAYAALLGTQQELSVCLNGETRSAVSLLTESHPDLMTAIRQQPFSIKQAKQSAFTLLAKAPRFADPQIWLCKPYSPAALQASTSRFFVYDIAYRPYLRARERNRLRVEWRMQEKPEPLPAIPTSASGDAPR